MAAAEVVPTGSAPAASHAERSPAWRRGDMIPLSKRVNWRKKFRSTTDEIPIAQPPLRGAVYTGADTLLPPSDRAGGIVPMNIYRKNDEGVF